jgi:hypothetical protein
MTDDDRYINRWTLDKNAEKQGKQPDYRGRLNVEGVEYFLDGWIKEGRKGKFISGNIKRVERKEGVAKPAATSANRGDAFDDDSEIPF